VRCGYVSKDAAEKYYGAVFQPGGTKLDIPTTQTRRGEMRRAGLPLDEPIADTGAPSPAPSHAHSHGEVDERLSEEERVALAMSGRCCS
jgi:N-methylhydantoinase B